MYIVFTDWAKITICYIDPITCDTVCDDIWFANGDKLKKILEKEEDEGLKIKEISIKGYGSPDGQSLGDGTILTSKGTTVDITKLDGNLHDITDILKNTL